MVMGWNIDIAIFIGFLVVNIIFGLWSSRGVTTMGEYAVGDRDFSTGTIVATLVATWVSGSMFFNWLIETYSSGLYAIMAMTGDIMCLLIVGLFFAPRLGEFLGKFSIAEAMGSMYGEKVRMITAFSGFIGTAGYIAVQLKVAGLLFDYCFDLPSGNVLGIIISGTIITAYASFGGIKSVTFTDVIQFFTFGTIIPIITFAVLGTIDGTDALINTIATHHLFDIEQVFNTNNPKSVAYFFIFLFCIIPSFNPALFQRVAMAKNVVQVKKTFVIAAFTCLFLSGMMIWLGVLLISSQPDLAPHDIVKHLVSDYSIVGLKGLILAGVMAMVMSTADSYINSASILVVHDFCSPINMKPKTRMYLVRFASAFIGLASIVLAMREGGLLKLVIATSMLYMPIVTVPFIMSLIGFRSSGKSVLIGMVGGLVGVVIWEMFLKIGDIDGLVPGILSNLVCLLLSHYILRQPGGWIDIADTAGMNRTKAERRMRREGWIEAIRSFNFIRFIKTQAPSNDNMTMYLGLFCIISIYSAMHSIPVEAEHHYSGVVQIIYTTVLIMATGLLGYPLWLNSWRNTAVLGVYTNICLFYILICSSFTLVVISDFAPLPLMAFTMNLMIVALMLRWQWALVMIILGIGLTIWTLSLMANNFSEKSLVTFEFKTVYVLLLMSSILIIFLKPKQDRQEISDEKIDYLLGKLEDQKKEIYNAFETRNEFLRNLQHEAHTPITGIMSMAQVIDESYDEIPEGQRREAVHNIANNTDRLLTYVDNLIDVSKLSSLNYKLNREEVDLSSLVIERLHKCQKLHISYGDNAREFILDIQPKIIANCDRYYIKRTIDNLIVNAISFCKKGKITLKLHKTNGSIEFSIADEGIGVPTSELMDIFGTFTTSSKTKTIAGGRGVGLALARKAIELHGGRIWAESDGDCGSVFRFVLAV